MPANNTEASKSLPNSKKTTSKKISKKATLNKNKDLNTKNMTLLT